MLSRTLMSRPNMEKVIGMTGMEPEIKGPDGREMLITRLGKELTVVSAGGDNLFTIAYTDKDPKRAELVVQSLLTIFVEGSRSDQRKDAEAAQRFIDEEISNYKKKLDEAENALIEFKRRQVLAAGARGESAVQLASLEGTLRELALELKIAELGKAAIEKSGADQAEMPDLLGEQGAEGGGASSEIDTRIKALEQKLDGLRLTYTEQHPDVVALTRTIAQLEEQKKAQAKSRSSAPSAARTPGQPTSQQARLSLATAEANVASVKARLEEYSKRYQELRAAAMAAPEADAQYQHLSRDYEMAKSTYASMLSRRETARISDKMESTAGGTNFRIVDPPQVSSRPKSPDRSRLNLIVLVLALAGGAALAYLLSQLMPTISDERRLREVTGAQVLATVLRDWSEAEKKQRIRDMAAFLMSFVSLLSAYAAITFAVALVSAKA
jgi:polysaccharide chain length determinant protein (PEP-CTERM system associated)